MREIINQVFQTGFEYELGVGWCYVLVGSNGIILIDPGYGWHFSMMNRSGQMVNGGPVLDNGLFTPNLMELLDFCASVKKKIKKCILTHSHKDHSANMELLQRKETEIHKYYKTEIMDMELIVHENSVYKKKIYRKIQKRSRLSIEGHKLLFIPTPGHSQSLDDISIYLPEKKILFCGDICQPQGRDYHICDGPSPIPFFFDGDKGKKSITSLMNLDFEVLLTAHGYQYNRKEGLLALSITRSSLETIDILAKKLIQENTSENPDTIAVWVYDTITHQRRFDPVKAEVRKFHYDRHGVSDFQKFDKVTIDYFLTKHRNRILERLSSNVPDR